MNFYQRSHFATLQANNNNDIRIYTKHTRAPLNRVNSRVESRTEKKFKLRDHLNSNNFSLFALHI
jgi:hypothetical protein